MSEEVQYLPMDLPKRILMFFQRWTHMCSVQYPVRCGVCGRKTKGNFITGYWMPCLQDRTHANQ